MDIYKCPKSKIQKNFPFKNFNILYNKFQNLLKAKLPLVKAEGKKKGVSFLFLFFYNFKMHIPSRFNQ